jgi:hypothetical protein
MPPLLAVRAAFVPPFANETGVTKAIVPLVVIVPPLKPVPAVMLVTVPVLVAAIVMLLWAFVTVMPAPAVMVPARGAPAVEPITNCPSVKASHVGTPVALVDNEAELTVASPLTTLAAEL